MMMFSRSFSPSKLPRPPPPPPPPPPPLQEKRHKRRQQRRHNTSTSSSNVSLTSTIQNEKPLENPLLVLSHETDNIDIELSTDRIEQQQQQHPQQYKNNNNISNWNAQHNNIKAAMEESTITTDAIEEYHLGTVHVKHSTHGCGSSITPVVSSTSMEMEGSSNGGAGAESSDSSISGSWRNRLRLFHLFQRKHHYYNSNNHHNHNHITKSCETSITASRSPTSSNDITQSTNSNNNNNSIYMNGPSDTNIRKNKNGIVRQQSTRSSSNHKIKNYSKTVPIQKTQQPESLYYNNQEYTNSQYLKYQQHCNNDNPTGMIDDDNVNDPVYDFDESEWTPMDSSYGAAIPLAGWIPKGIRRSIEFTVLVCIALIIVFFIVETSVRSDMKNHKSNNNSNSNNSNLYDVVMDNFNDDIAWNYTSNNDNMTSVYGDDLQIDDNNAGG